MSCYDNTFWKNVVTILKNKKFSNKKPKKFCQFCRNSKIWQQSSEKNEKNVLNQRKDESNVVKIRKKAYFWQHIAEWTVHYRVDTDTKADHILAATERLSKKRKLSGSKARRTIRSQSFCRMLRSDKKDIWGKRQSTNKNVETTEIVFSHLNIYYKAAFLFISLAEVFAACILNCHFSRMDYSNRVHIQVRMYYHNLRRNFLLCPLL